MSRYIDADKVTQILNDSMCTFPDCYVAENIEQLPHIDIVRCKECKYEPICSHSVQHTTHEPTSVTIGYKSVDFCSYGERSE